MIPRAIGQFMKFCTVGAVGTLAHYAVLWLATERLGWQATWGSGAGYLVGSAVNYALNYRFTFASDKSHLEAAGRFYIVVGAGWLINTSLMGVLTVWLRWDVWLAQVLTTGIGLGWNYSGSKFWAFDDARATSALPMTITGRVSAGRE